MTAALLLVDLQRDFLEREALQPSAGEILEQAKRLLDGFRARNLAVLHAHTLVGPDGSDRMPHWKRDDFHACVEGTPGARAPAPVSAINGEPVFRKTFYSAFQDPRLDVALQRCAADPLIVAGVYLHGCLRQTVLDAYARGFRVWVAADASGTFDPLHGWITREYLASRAAEILPVDDILRRLANQPTSAAVPVGRDHPVACIGGCWISQVTGDGWEQRNPSRWSQVLGRVPLAGNRQVDAAVAAAARGREAWTGGDAVNRAETLGRWADALERREPELVSSMAIEIGKPVADARTEIRNAVRSLHATLRLSGHREPWHRCGSGGVASRPWPLGIVAIITPWNSPVLIPVSKLGAALAFGNASVWKPAIQAPETSRLVLDALLESGCAPELVSMVAGNADTAARLIAHPGVSAVSMTGSISAGRQAALSCAAQLKPLQAELGGNNAALVCADCEVETVAGELALSAFGFAGQRCTATRRVIIERDIAEGFREAFVAAARALAIGDPRDPDTRVGPLISRARREQVQKMLEETMDNGGRLLSGGGIPPDFQAGCWLEPTVIDNVGADSDIVQRETFAPLVVLQTARNFAEALRLCNSVSHGLVASLYSADPARRERFLATAEAGLLKLDQPTAGADPEAPFSGWKASGLGPPEHGRWDREFYTRTQALYGWNGEGHGE